MKRKQYFSFILVAALIFSLLCPINAHAFNLTGNVDTSNTRLSNIFEDQLSEMKRNTAMLCGLNNLSMVDAQISSITTIVDFSGNEYTLVECEPTGYMIYHNDSGIFVESSLVVHSPFYGIKGDVRYCGPNEYYVNAENSKDFRYVFDEECLSGTQIQHLKEKSALVNQTLIENSNENVLNYISGISNVRPYATGNQISAKTVTGDGWTLVDNYSFFANLNDCGYISGGKCGYIAAGILLAYDKIYNGMDTIPNWYYSYNDGRYSLSPSLPTALYNKGVSLGYGASTTSVAIHYTVKSWLGDRGIITHHTSLYVPFGNNLTIVSKLKNDRPVIWFGAVTDQTFDSTTGNHAVVVYGHSWSGNNFVAHFGWENATMVYFSGVLGSLYTYDVR